MKKIIIISSLVLYLFASDDYVPLSNLSQEKKVEYNFINKKTEINTAGNNEYEKIKNINKNDNIQTFKDEIIEEKQELSKPINNEFVKEYKKDNILKDEKKVSQSNFSKDFSITPKILYMNIATDIEKQSVEKTHEVVPEILFTYKNHNLKFDYLNVDLKYQNILELDTKWYRLAYLYSFYNANIGLAYNYLDINYSLLGINAKDNQKFATFEAHLKNSKDNFIVEYGGFYGKNNDIKNAYEYYLTLGYKIFSNDNLIFNAGYKNRIVENSDIKIEYKGPIVGISSKF